MNGHSGDRKAGVVVDSSKQWKQAHVRIAGTGRAQFGSSHITYEMSCTIYEGWNFNSGNYLFTTDTK